MKTLTNLADLTKESIADLYVRSLRNVETRKTHLLATFAGQPITGSIPVGGDLVPTVHDLKLDFKAFYGGILALAQMIDPETTLPPTNQMSEFIVQHFDQVKTAIAA